MKSSIALSSITLIRSSVACAAFALSLVGSTLAQAADQHNYAAMINADGSVTAGQIKIEVAGPSVPVAERIAMAEKALEVAGGNVFALTGNDGGIQNANSAAIRGGHVWLTASN